MIMKHCSILMIFFLIACNAATVKKNEHSKKQNIQFSGKYLVCDTCSTIIIVHHDECTNCGEISVDSGTVFITSNILRTIDSFGNSLTRIDSTNLFSNAVSVKELYFSDPGYFKNLWKDTVNFMDLYKVFRLTGKVTEIKRRVLDNGVVEENPSLFFKADKAEEIDTAYLKKITQ